MKVSQKPLAVGLAIQSSYGWRNKNRWYGFERLTEQADDLPASLVLLG